MTNKQNDPKTKPNWLKWPIGLIGFVPPYTPITTELLSKKVDEALNVGADSLAFPCEVEGYALWPTKVIPPAPNAAIPDVLGSLIEIAHKNGLKVIGHWMGVHCQSSFWNSHPEWLQRKYDGELIEAVPGGTPWPAMCLNSPFGDNLLNQVDEVLRLYPIDGIYCDGLYQRFTGCYCEYCQKKFSINRRDPMPEDTLGPTMMRFREETVCDFLSKFRDIIDRASPETPFILDTVGPTLGWLRGEDIPRMRQYVDIFLLESYWEVRRQLIWTDGMEARLTRALSGLDVWSPKWLARSPDHEHVAVPEDSVRTWMGQSIANACPPFPLEQNLFQVDASLMPVLAEVNEHSRIVGEYLADAQPLVNIALLYPYQSLRAVDMKDREIILEHFQGAYQALSEHHIPFEPITEEQIISGVLAGMDLCLIPNAKCLSDKTVEMLSSYAHEGGNLILCFETGMKDDAGEIREDPALWDLAGVKAIGKFDAFGPRGIAGYGGGSPTLYCRINYSHPITEGLENRLTSFSGSTLLLEIEDNVETVAQVLDYDPEVLKRDGFFTWYPGEVLSPLITARETEWGSRIVFIAGDLTRSYWLHGWPELSQLLAQSVSWATGTRPPYKIISNHPLVEVRGYVRNEEGELILILSNLASNQMATVRGGGFPADPRNLIRNHHVTHIVPQANIKILLHGELGQGKNVHALLSSEISSEIQGDSLEILIPRLGPYEVVLIE
ncbi:MAG: hypothetical protein GTO18_10035 [Anaerolineales bacterium]|nr:hypothetical protein [Anaerolineales bacterium]